LSLAPLSNPSVRILPRLLTHTAFLSRLSVGLSNATGFEPVVVHRDPISREISVLVLNSVAHVSWRGLGLLRRISQMSLNNISSRFGNLRIDDQLNSRAFDES
jgi:hypothetical protein